MRIIGYLKQSKLAVALIVVLLIVPICRFLVTRPTWLMLASSRVVSKIARLAL